MNARVQLILNELRQRLEALYGPRLVRMILYGSQVRGDAEPGSDIDVLVVLRGLVQAGEEIERTGSVVADLSLRFDEAISCVFLDEKRFVTRDGPFLRNVRREGIVI
jgi:predicted nucleotidyltransferase